MVRTGRSREARTIAGAVVRLNAPGRPAAERITPTG
jgi:hypothetical protein